MQVKTKKICYMWWKGVSEEKESVLHMLEVMPVRKKKLCYTWCK